MNEEYDNFIETRKENKWNPDEVKYLINTYAHVFAIQYNSKELCISCAGSGKRLKEIQDKLDKVYYDKEYRVKDRELCYV